MAAAPEGPRPRARGPRLTGDEQRRRLMDAAMDRFATDGYAATTVAHIVDDARVSRTTFYRHFADREDVLVACLDHVLDRVVADLGEAILSSTNQVDRQVEVIRNLLAVLAAEERYAPVLLMETVGPSSRATSRLWEVLDALEALITEADQRASSELGRAPVQLPLAETALVGAFYVWICGLVRAGTLAAVTADPEVPRRIVAATQAARTALVDD